MLNLSGLAKFLLLTLIFSFLSCRKDVVESILQHSKRCSVPIQGAMRWYAQQKSNRVLTDEDVLNSINVTPDWDYIQIVPFKDSTDLLMVPIKDTLNDIFPKAIVQLVFYYDSLNNITSSLFVIEPSESYYSSHGNVYHTEDFCGVSININQEGCIENMIKYDSGTMFQINADSIPESVIIETRGDPTSNCPIWGKSKHKSQWWRKFMKWLNNNTGGGGMSDGDWAEGGGWWNDNWDGNQLPPFNGSGGNGNSGWNTNPNGPSGGFGFNLFNNYFYDAVFESSQYRDQVKKCKGNFIYSNDVNTPAIFSIDKSIFGFDYKLFLGAYDYYLDQLSLGNINFQLKDAFAIVQTPPATFKFFSNPFNLSQWKPKFDPIYQKMKQDYEDHRNCNGSLNSGPDGNTNCNCFEYMVEDVKEDLSKIHEMKPPLAYIAFKQKHGLSISYEEFLDKTKTCNIYSIDYKDCVEQKFNWYYENTDGGADFGKQGAVWGNHSSFQSQSLPTYSAFQSALPRTIDKLNWLKGADNIYPLAGGDVYQLRLDDLANGSPNPTDNTCAVKISIALNGSGVVIPHIYSDNNHNGIQDTGEPDITFAGENGLYYFVRAEFLIKYMLEAFPTPIIVPNIDISNGATPKSSFGTKKGIYAMLPINPSLMAGASGHCDIFYDEGCAFGCYWVKEIVQNVYLWELN